MTIIYGLCGSGKSFAARTLAEQTGQPFFEQPQGRNLFPVILAWLRAGQSCIVEEILFFDKGRRDWIESEVAQIPTAEIKWICFENDLATANHNLEVREHAEVERLKELNRQWSPGYTFPAKCERRRIFKA